MAGIYRITNKTNGKSYVGATTRSFEERWSKHKSDLRKGRHGNIHLQRAWDKYGENNFDFSVLEELQNVSFDVLAKKEENYAETLNAQYNIAPFDRPFHIVYGRKLSTEHIEKLRQCQLGRKWTDEEKIKLSIALKGHYQPPCSEETKKRLSESLKGKKKGPMSEEHRKNISLVKRGKTPYKMTDAIRKKISKNRTGICKGSSHVNYKGKYRFTHPIYGEVILAQCDLVRNYGISECKASLLCSGKRKSHKQWECKGKVE